MTKTSLRENDTSDVVNESKQVLLFFAGVIVRWRDRVVLGWKGGFFFVVEQIVIDMVWELGISRKRFGAPLVQPFLLLSGIAYGILPRIAS
jgi:hypothetical protein